MKFDDTKHPFRTASGLTGKDAYTFELAQIRNQHRELKARLARLTETIVAELPDAATSTHELGTFESTIDSDTIRRMLPMFTLDDMSLQDYTNLVRNLQVTR